MLPLWTHDREACEKAVGLMQLSSDLHGLSLSSQQVGFEGNQPARMGARLPRYMLQYAQMPRGPSSVGSFANKASCKSSALLAGAPRLRSRVGLCPGDTDCGLAVIGDCRRLLATICPAQHLPGASRATLELSEYPCRPWGERRVPHVGLRRSRRTLLAAPPRHARPNRERAKHVNAGTNTCSDGHTQRFALASTPNAHLPAPQHQ